jgi:hypothetical protein
VRPSRPLRTALGLAAWAVALLCAASPARAAPACGAGWATSASLGRPTAATAWRAGIIGRTPLWRVPHRAGVRRLGVLRPRDASWLLVLGATRDRFGRCWLRLRLPSRPNDAAAWVSARRVELRPTRWRIAVSRRARRFLSTAAASACAASAW